MSRVLVIEDDIETSREIVACLEAGGFRTKQCFDGRQGMRLALTDRFDAVTLDRMLPGCDGLQIVTSMREEGVETPVLLLSALGDVDDRVAGLRVGGDDYLVKPFAPSELVVRMQVLLRRHARPAKTDLALRVGDLELDLVLREARRNGRTIELLPMEFKLLEFLMRHSGQLLSRRIIFEHVWEYYFDPGTNLIDVHIGRLRKKIDDPGGPSFIKTERGVGYVLNAV
jgi:two-component system, OmpR family, response regulator